MKHLIPRFQMASSPDEDSPFTSSQLSRPEHKRIDPETRRRTASVVFVLYMQAAACFIQKPGW